MKGSPEPMCITTSFPHAVHAGRNSWWSFKYYPSKYGRPRFHSLIYWPRISILFREIIFLPDYASLLFIKKSNSCSHKRPWRPIGLCEVGEITFSRQLFRRWQWGCQPYAPAALCMPGRVWYLISVRGWINPMVMVLLKGLGKFKISNDLISIRTRNIPVCSLSPQSTALLHCHSFQESASTVTGVRRYETGRHVVSLLQFRTEMLSAFQVNLNQARHTYHWISYGNKC
jgi:hypothetical protein